MVFNGFRLGLVGFGGWWTYWACLKHWAYLQIAILIVTLMINFWFLGYPSLRTMFFFYREIVVKKSVILGFSRFSSHPWMTGCWFHVFFFGSIHTLMLCPREGRKIYPQALRLSNMGMVNPSFLYGCPLKTTICREFPIAMFDF